MDLINSQPWKVGGWEENSSKSLRSPMNLSPVMRASPNLSLKISSGEHLSPKIEVLISKIFKVQIQAEEQKE